MALFGWANKSRVSGDKTDVIILQPGAYAFNIVGEASYQSTLADLVGGKSEDGANHYFMALIAPERNNRHDPNAVRVAIENRTVGYLDRRHAAEYRHYLGDTPAVCCANVVGGWHRARKNDEGHFGVKLAIAWPPSKATFG